MSEDLHKYIRQARESGADHQAIKDRLIKAGWHPEMVHNAMEQHMPPETANGPAMHSSQPQMPIAVVQALSTRGVEYYLMLISLAVSALSLGAILHSIAAQLFTDAPGYYFASGVMSFAGAALIVSLPLFIFFFLRLKKAELVNPQLFADPSRRRATQIALILSFIVGLIGAISYVFAFFNMSYNSDTGTSVGLTIADLVITVLIVGGIFAYYWLDSHKKGDR